jgi:hypothetical protein
MNGFKRWLGSLFARLRRKEGRHDLPPMNRHELRDIGLEGWSRDRPPPRDERGERVRGRDPFSW